MSSTKKNKNLLDLYLSEVFKNFVALKDDDVKKSQEVFKSVFEQVRVAMGKQCKYFECYSSQVMYGGSVYDGIKVSRLDEFDMDIVIRLPINYDEGENGITIENELPGFVKLKITKAFDNLVKQSNWENRHVVTHTWRDNESYLRQDKFRSWIQGLVQKAMNEFNGQVTVNGVTYSLKYTASGPAYTLNVASLPNTEDEPFKLDVDLVPVIKFTHPRWPKGYRQPNAVTAKDWLVVPKPNKDITDGQLQNRCWRLSFQDFEKELMKGCQNLKTTIRLVKKMRNVLNLDDISSYSIKTLFLWKVSENDKKFWDNKVSFLYKIMVEELYNAIKNKNIPYFWNQQHNLIGGLKISAARDLLSKISTVLEDIKSNDAERLLPSLLTIEEVIKFRELDFNAQKNRSAVNRNSRNNDPVDIALLKAFQLQMEEISKKVEELNMKINSTTVNEHLIEEHRSLVQQYDVIQEEARKKGFWEKIGDNIHDNFHARGGVENFAQQFMDLVD
ncbi:cyclic GMP-AMP synthase-like receptor isoform X1 [Achroia grisella]|uniref:cyclic GMP-AMP synthase-like receptor isoform X1 n=1 Tax=Achroia grisella TaxID=688607 RepID=UPI0027D31F26|nr:cyclic GMP-AMP synthase-like receptor isoform X1 [Achroia grisella]XP_059061414.1 cyclic GMP-AMP synthase-like receptor isoform X1 [Achroia grisella]XP_059061415.1 cyclic GMP-AMP synthase-like receptor isoform X1 [Achroia grisella]